ncbi:ABC transporter permease [Aromatoleum sp.]|uniref:ABC transporter permease n=1 Tax=Aromatoleum sp. TaxID=2307007 RepID=UPI002FCC07F5
MPRTSFGRSALTVRLAARNLLRQRRRAALALGIVCGGVIAYLLAGGFIEWVFQSMRHGAIYSQLGHVQITRPGYFREGLGDPYKYLLPRDTGVVTKDGVQGVRTVAPRLAFSGLISLGDVTVSFLGEGIDPVLEAPITEGIIVAAGQDLTAGGPQSVMLGEGLAEQLGATPGDTVVLLSTPADGGLNAVELTVAGLFATASKAFDDSALRVPIDVARNLMRVDGATSWAVLLERTEATDDFVERLRTRLSPADFEIFPWSDLADFYNKTVELFSRQVGAVRFLIALIVILSISNTLSMAVIERTGEIGTAMALGIRRRGILGLFLGEGILLGLFGGVLGLVLGITLAAVLSAIGIPMPPPPGMGRGYIGEIIVTPALALDAFLLAFMATLIASVFPAWKASRMNIVDALRHQR